MDNFNNVNNQLNTKSFDILSNVMFELKDEMKKIQQNISINDDQIEEIQRYIKDVLNRDNNDMKAFYPRNNEVIYQDRLKELNSKIVEFQKENKILYQKLIKLHKKVENISYIMDDKKHNQIKINLEKKIIDNIHDNKLNSTDDKLIQYIRKNALDVQEKERHRIARDLHDSTVQSLAHLIHKTELCSKYIDNDPIRAKLELAALNTNIKTVVNDMRAIIYQLRPMTFDDMGIYVLLDNLKSELEKQTTIKLIFEIELIYSKEELLLLSVFRIIQEGTRNAIKHSKGTFVKVSCKCDDKYVYIEIQDDGIGIKEEDKKRKNHFGLEILEERVNLLSGTLSILGVENKGTNISISIPYKREKIND